MLALISLSSANKRCEILSPPQHVLISWILSSVFTSLNRTDIPSTHRSNKYSCIYPLGSHTPQWALSTLSKPGFVYEFLHKGLFHPVVGLSHIKLQRHLSLFPYSFCSQAVQHFKSYNYVISNQSPWYKCTMGVRQWMEEQTLTYLPGLLRSLIITLQMQTGLKSTTRNWDYMSAVYHF